MGQPFLAVRIDDIKRKQNQKILTILAGLVHARVGLGFSLEELDSGAGDGNRTHVRSLGSFYTAIVRRPLSLAR